MTSLDLFAVAFMAALSTPAALCLVQKVVVGDISTPSPVLTPTHRNIFVLVIVVLYRAMVKSAPAPTPRSVAVPPRRRPRKALKPKGYRAPQQATERSSQKLLEGPRQPKLEVKPEVKPTGCKGCDNLGYQCATCESSQKEEYYQGLDGNKLLDTLYALQEELEAERPLVLKYRKPRVDRDSIKDVRFSHGVKRRTSNRRFKGTWL